MGYTSFFLILVFYLVRWSIIGWIHNPRGLLHICNPCVFECRYIFSILWTCRFDIWICIHMYINVIPHVYLCVYVCTCICIYFNTYLCIPFCFDTTCYIRQESQSPYSEVDFFIYLKECVYIYFIPICLQSQMQPNAGQIPLWLNGRLPRPVLMTRNWNS